MGADASPLRAGVSCWRRGRPPAHVMGPTGRQARSRAHALRPRPAELVWRFHQCADGGRGTLSYSVRRYAWVPEAYDLAITAARLLVWPMRSGRDDDAVAAISHTVPQYKLPTNGLARYKTLVAACGDQDDYLAHHAVDMQSNDGTTLNRVITARLRHAMAQAASRRSLTVRQAEIACRAAQTALSHALRQRWAEGRTAVAQAAVARCRTANQLALAVLRRAKRSATAARIAAAMATDKKAMWHELELAGTEEGAARCSGRLRSEVAKTATTTSTFQKI